MLFFSLGVLKPQILLARTIAPLTRVALEALPAGPPPAEAKPQAETPPPADVLQSMSIGEPSHGRLINGVQLVTDERFQVRGDENWGTAETVAGIRDAVEKVALAFPGTPRVVVGDLSKEHGGRIWPHKSHQSGRDVDLGFYVKGGQPTTFAPVGPNNIDLERNWALIEALAATDQVQYIFIDRRVQRLLYDYAKNVKKVTAATLSTLFEYPGRGSLTTLVRHRRGHRDHLHVRFFSPLAVATGEKYGAQALAAAGASLDPLQTVRFSHTIRKGDTLARIAQRYRVDLTDIMKWNRLKRRTTLQVGQSIALYRKIKVAVNSATAPAPDTLCHAGPRGAVGCWHPTRT